MSVELLIETDEFCLCSEQGLEPFWIRAKDGTIVCQRCRRVQGYREPEPPPEIEPPPEVENENGKRRSKK